MRVLVHCSCDNNIETRERLEHYKIPYAIINSDSLVYDVHNDEPFYLELVSVVKNRWFIEIAEYSKDELENASWLIMRSKCGKVSTADEKYTFRYDCQWNNDPEKFHHETQIREYILTKKICWKPKNNFYADECGNNSTIFCSEYAKQILSDNVTGIDFRAVLQKNSMEPRSDIYQLIFSHRIPHEALILPDDTNTITCNNCGKKQFWFTKPNNYSIKVKSSYLDSKADAYVSEDLFGQGFGYHLIFVSRKVYKTITDMKERNIVFQPVELIQE